VTSVATLYSVVLR